AIIGGNSSDRARDLAEKLRDVAARPGGAAPLFLITTATADQVPTQNDPSQWVRLDGIHAGRTYRFCFSDRQMARAVADFIWSQDELRPDEAPVFLVSWKDDPYSLDLAEGFHDVLAEDRFQQSFQQRPASPRRAPFWGIVIPHSVGTFN